MAFSIESICKREDEMRLRRSNAHTPFRRFSFSSI
jgi:hypothetical protein